MAAPCRNCGATKTEPVRPNLRQKLARQFGYDLRKCARCRKIRLLRRRQPAGEPAVEPAQVTAESQPETTVYDPDGFNGCPRCGEASFHRSRRGWLEREVLRSPPMVRCSACGYRFPAPQM